MLCQPSGEAMTERKTLRGTPAMREALGIQPEPVPASPAPVPPPAQPSTPDKRARNREVFRRTHKLLRERYPELFTASRPLAIGIYHQIRAAIGREELRSRDLNLFLAGWTKWPAYRAALARGDRRVNLDGSDAGPALVEPRAA